MQTDSAASFLDSVLRLKPRVAAFDCDGTLWSGDVGEGFFDWELKRGLVSEAVAKSMRARYADYKAGRVSEDDMCGEMVTMHRGMPESALLRATSDYFQNSFPGHIFPEMRELVERLQQNGCDVWAVSSSNEWLIRAGMKHFGIPDNRLLAASVEIEDGMITDRIVRLPSGPGKPLALREVAMKDIDAAFGNSRWDTEMLAMAKHAFAVNPNPDLEATARQRNWTIYFPDRTKPAQFFHSHSSVLNGTVESSIYNIVAMYSARLLDHFQDPRNAGDVSDPDARVEIENPACGDVLRLTLKFSSGRISEIGFKAKGCVPSMACGSALTELVSGKTPDEARKLRREDVIAAVGGLPKASTHAAQLALDALSAALNQLPA